MISNNVVQQFDDKTLADAFYAAETIDSLLIAIREYLINAGIDPQFSIAFHVSSQSELVVKHRSNSRYDLDQKVFVQDDEKGNIWVSENPVDTLLTDIIDLTRCLAVPFSVDGKMAGVLILEKQQATLEQQTIQTLSTLLSRNFVRIELYQLYNRQHQHDSVKLSSIDRMKTVMRELELDRVLTGLIELILSTVSGSAACFVLHCPEVQELKTTTEFGVTQKELNSLIHNEHGAIADYVTNKQQAWLTSERWEFTEFKQSSFLDRLSTFLILPIAARDGSGCLFIADPDNVTENALDIAQTIVQLSRISIDNALLHAQVLEKAIHKQQLEIAGDVQNSLMPDEAPGTLGVAVSGLNLPCDDSGGDYYDFIELPDKKLCFVLADATGHGIGAAILATTARAMLRTLLQNQSNDINLSFICKSMNDLLESDLAADKFITMFIGLYDPFDRTLVYASAGHDPPLMMYHPDQDSFTELECTGLPFGMFPNMNYDVSSKIRLAPGTLLTLSSDGIPEAANACEKMYGKERLQDFIRENALIPPDVLCKAIVKDVTDFRNTAPQTDDITIVILSVDQQIV